MIVIVKRQNFFCLLTRLDTDLNEICSQHLRIRDERDLTGSVVAHSPGGQKKDESAETLLGHRSRTRCGTELPGPFVPAEGNRFSSDTSRHQSPQRRAGTALTGQAPAVPDRPGADLAGADLTDIDLSEAKISGVRSGEITGSPQALPQHTRAERQRP